MTTSVAVIGIGSLGAPVARRLVAAGYDVTVCDVNPKALEPFEGRARIVGRAADCAAAEVVIVLVATPSQVASVLLGIDGLVEGVGAGAPPAVVVMSTISEPVVHDLDRGLRERGMTLVDAPVSGGPQRAENGSLTVILGGADSDIAFVRPVLTSIGDRMFHCGPVGSAQVVKLINNLVCAANVAISGEAFRLAIEHGMKVSDVAPILEVSTGRNFLTGGSSGTPEEYYARWSEGGMRGVEGWLSIIRKDVGLALGLAVESSGDYPVMTGLRQILDSLGDETFENWRTVAGPGRGR